MDMYSTCAFDKHFLWGQTPIHVYIHVHVHVYLYCCQTDSLTFKSSNWECNLSPSKSSQKCPAPIDSPRSKYSTTSPTVMLRVSVAGLSLAVCRANFWGGTRDLEWPSQTAQEGQQNFNWYCTEGEHIVLHVFLPLSSPLPTHAVKHQLTLRAHNFDRIGWQCTCTVHCTNLFL